MGAKRVTVRGARTSPIHRTSSLTPLLLMGMLTSGEWNSGLIVHIPSSVTLSPIVNLLCPQAWPSRQSPPQHLEASGLCLKT